MFLNYNHIKKLKRPSGTKHCSVHWSNETEMSGYEVSCWLEWVRAFAYPAVSASPIPYSLLPNTGFFLCTWHSLIRDVLDWLHLKLELKKPTDKLCVLLVYLFMRCSLRHAWSWTKGWNVLLAMCHWKHFQLMLHLEMILNLHLMLWSSCCVGWRPPGNRLWPVHGSVWKVSLSVTSLIRWFGPQIIYDKFCTLNKMKSYSRMKL